MKSKSESESLEAKLYLDWQGEDIRNKDVGNQEKGWQKPGP